MPKETPEEIQARLERGKVWLNSEEGQKKIKEARKEASKEIRRLFGPHPSCTCICPVHGRIR